LLGGKESSIPRGPETLLVSVFTENQLLPSTFQGSLDRLADVLCIARLLAEHSGDVQNAIAVGVLSAEQITEEVGRLVHELEGRLNALAHSIDRDIEAARTVAHAVDALCWRLRSAEEARQRVEKQVKLGDAEREKT
jgi:hypothetical protein